MERLKEKNNNHCIKIISFELLGLLILLLAAGSSGNKNENLPAPPPPRRSRLRPNPAVVESYHSSSSETLTDSEICDLDNHAGTIVNVLFAQDISGADLRDMSSNRPEELDGFFEYIRNIFMYAVHGDGFLWNEDTEKSTKNEKKKINYLLHRIIEKILKVLYESCTDNFFNQMAYSYDANSRSIEFNRNLQVSTSNRCLCSRASTTSTCSHRMPKTDRLDIHFPEFRFNYDEVENAETRSNKHPRVVDGIEIQMYHIVPPSLIVKFLNSWLVSDTRSAPSYENNRPYHDCVNGMFERLKHHLLKIIIHEIKRGVYGLTDDDNYNFIEIANENFFRDMYNRWNYQSRGGNNFYGPRDRGAFNPAEGVRKPDLIRTFESLSRLLIGEERYQNLLEIFDLLIDYVERVSDMTLTERLVQGIKIFLNMLTTFEHYEAVPFNPRLWEKGSVDSEEDEEELARRGLTKEQIRRFKRNEYWKIKGRQAGISPMGVRDEGAGRLCFGIGQLAKRRWNEFVLRSTKTLLDHHARGFTTSVINWECSFVKLYYSYRFYEPTAPRSSELSVVECLKKSNFDSFLYHYLSKKDDWRDCLYHNSTKQPEQWCKAWRRIMLNSNAVVEESAEWAMSYDNESEMYKQDVETLWNWLVDEINITDQSIRWIADNPFYFNNNFVYARDNQKFFDSVCYSYAKGTTLGCPNDCPSARSKRSIDLLDLGPSVSTRLPIINYQQEWFIDVDYIFKCRCPINSNLNREPGFVQKIINWLKNLTPCNSDSTKRDSPRCDELRR